jgi:hypothetical protein
MSKMSYKRPWPLCRSLERQFVPCVCQKEGHNGCTNIDVLATAPGHSPWPLSWPIILESDPVNCDWFFHLAENIILIFSSLLFFPNKIMLTKSFWANSDHPFLFFHILWKWVSRSGRSQHTLIAPELSKPIQAHVDNVLYRKMSSIQINIPNYQ